MTPGNYPQVGVQLPPKSVHKARNVCTGVHSTLSVLSGTSLCHYHLRCRCTWALVGAAKLLERLRAAIHAYTRGETLTVGIHEWLGAL